MNYNKIYRYHLSQNEDNISSFRNNYNFHSITSRCNVCLHYVISVNFENYPFSVIVQKHIPEHNFQKEYSVLFIPIICEYYYITNQERSINQDLFDWYCIQSVLKVDGQASQTCIMDYFQQRCYACNKILFMVYNLLTFLIFV